jgi:choline kinase
MATPISVALPDNKIPTQNMVRDIVAAFLTKEWQYVDPETLNTSYHA